MKPKFTHLFTGALLVTGLLGSTSTSFARPPAARYANHGIIETVDHAANSFTLVSEKDAARQTFVWRTSTGFRQKSPQPCAGWITRWFSLGAKTTAESLRPGSRVQFYYRKEAGRYRVSNVTVIATKNQVCDCCSRSTSAPPEGLLP